MITGLDWMEPAPSVGKAKTMTEARQLIRDAGYRIMWSGGLHELAGSGSAYDPFVWLITVHPPM